MSRFGWYIKRLKVMGPVEILWRLIERVRLFHLWTSWKCHREWNQLKLPESSRFKFCNSNNNELPHLKWTFVSGFEIEESFLCGYCKALGFSWKWQKGCNSWHIAPDTGNEWPYVFFGSISYRQNNPYGDARVVWEPSRLQQLVTLALLARAESGDKRNQVIILLEDELLSWSDDNPPLTGIHYVSAMECALRLIAVCYAYDIARLYLNRKKEVSNAVASIVISHANLIIHRLSLHSSSGNHTVAECAGLIYAGVLFSEFEGAKRWKARGEKIFFNEIFRQINKDGGGIEQALWYHVFILDLLGLVIKLYEHYGMDIKVEITDLYHAGRRFINVFATNSEELPNIGDSDNGYALSRYLNLIWDNASHKEGLTVFNKSGYSVYNNKKRKQQLVFDHGSLGMKPSFGHGHSDALSIILKTNNSPILIDSGTFTYTGDQKYREYFRSTRAHNTVVVDQLDQAVQEGPFLWSKPYSSKLIRHDILENGEISLVAMHDGYLRIGVIHWRGVHILPKGNVLVIDVLTGEGEHDIDLNWHLGMNVTKIESNEIEMGKEKIKVHGGKMQIYTGEVMPVNAWYSNAYGTKEKSHVINVKYKGKLPHEFITEVNLSGEFTNVSILEEKVSVIRRVIDDYRKV